MPFTLAWGICSTILLMFVICFGLVLITGFPSGLTPTVRDAIKVSAVNGWFVGGCFILRAKLRRKDELRPDFIGIRTVGEEGIMVPIFQTTA